MPTTDDSGAAPFVPVTDYDRRVLRALEFAKDGMRRYVWVSNLDQIMISLQRPLDRICTVCTPDGVAVNIPPDADESLIPGEG